MEKAQLFGVIASMFILISSCTSKYKNTSDNILFPPPNSFLETDLLESRPGFTGNVLGARVVESKIGPEGQQQIVNIELPVDPEKVDQVQVISESGQTLEQKRTAEILRNYENDNVGVIIYLSRQKNLSFRLRLIDNTGDN